MNDAPKTLDYYAANPDEMPTDPDVLMQLMGESGQPEPTPKQAEDSADGGAEEQTGQTSQDQAAPEQGNTEQEAPVASRDGKHTIPYDVLKTEREKRKAAEQAMRELQQRLETMQSSGTQQAGTEPKGDTSDDELEAMAQDFPAVAKLLAQTKKLEAQLQAVAQRVEQEDQLRQEQEVSQVRAAVDANPTLLHWEHNDPDRWAAAVKADQELQMSPAHRNLTLDQRLARAVEVVNAFYGADPTAPAQPQKQAPAAPAAAPKSVSAPRTLSDIPGGAVPVADPLEEFAQLSAEKLGSQMAGMTPDQIEALLARLG